MGRGGKREGGGRKRLEGVRRDRSGRVLRSSLTAVCACGAPRAEASARCRRCAPANRRSRIQECTHCGRVFHPTGARRCCSEACSVLRLAAVHASWRIPSAHSDRLRTERKRRGSARRAERLAAVTGSKKQKSGRWRRIADRDGLECWLCHQAVDLTVSVRHQRAPSADHVVPLAHGGSDDDSNLRLAHYGCNSRRGPGRFGAKVAA